MTVVALALRLALIWARHTYRFTAAPNHFGFGFETGSIAGAIARGEGFCSPFGVPHTGPTAWLAPIYPYLAALVFKILGIFSTGSAIAILAINSMFAALTCIPIFKIGERLFGRVVGLISGWTWAIVPFFFRWAITWVWDTSLSALLIALAVWAILDHERFTGRHWVAYGALAGISALVNPSLVTAFGCLALWAVWRHFRADGRIAYKEFAFFAITLVVVISPWLVRNRVVFGKWVFLRSNAGFEFWLGNFGGSPGVAWLAGHPTGSLRTMAQYERLGEIAFIEMKQAQGMAWVKAHRWEFVRTTAKRIADFWDGEVIRGVDDPWRPWMVLLTSVLAVAGLMFALLRRVPKSGVILIVMLIYPAPYYITLTAPRFRHPIEPLMVILTAYLASVMIDEFKPLFVARKAEAKQTSVAG